MTAALSFFHQRQKTLLLLASAYTIGLVLTHATLPPAHVWIIACIFSVLMNFTYITEALAQRRRIGTEAMVASLLIAASVFGVLLHPLFVIAAVFGHGLWDLAKHFGHGVPFFSWYTWSCCAVDMTYGATLLLYWLAT